MIRLLSTVTATALTGWLLVACPPAQAAFSRLMSASGVYSSATLQPPATASATCAPVNGTTSTATVSWTASPSTYATGYRVTSTPVSTTVNTASTARSTTLTVTRNRAYTFTVVATFRNWTSGARTTASVNC